MMMTATQKALKAIVQKDELCQLLQKFASSSRNSHLNGAVILALMANGDVDAQHVEDVHPVTRLLLDTDTAQYDRAWEWFHAATFPLQNPNAATPGQRDALLAEYLAQQEKARDKKGLGSDAVRAAIRADGVRIAGVALGMAEEDFALALKNASY